MDHHHRRSIKDTALGADTEGIRKGAEAGVEAHTGTITMATVMVTDTGMVIMDTMDTIIDRNIIRLLFL